MLEFFRNFFTNEQAFTRIIKGASLAFGAQMIAAGSVLPATPQGWAAFCLLAFSGAIRTGQMNDEPKLK